MSFITKIIVGPNLSHHIALGGTFIRYSFDKVNRGRGRHNITQYFKNVYIFFVVYILYILKLKKKNTRLCKKLKRCRIAYILRLRTQES